MPGAGCTGPGRVSSARAAVPRGSLQAELFHEPQGHRIDLDELDADLGRDRIHLRRPDDAPDGDDRLVGEVEGDAEDVAERDLAADRLEADPALRDVAAHAEEVARVDRRERDHLIRRDPAVFAAILLALLHAT